MKSNTATFRHVTALRWRPRLRPSLLGKFALVSFVLLAALAGALIWGIQAQLEQNALQQEADNAAEQVPLLLQPLLWAADMRAPLAPDKVKAIDGLVKQYLLPAHVVRVKIWLPDGTILYSDDQALIGKRFPVADDLQRTLAGTPSMDVSTLQDAENVDERGKFSRLLEIYVPLRPVDAAQIRGVYEVYHDLASLQPRIDDMRRFVAGSVSLGFLVLYTALFTLVRQASSDLTRHSAENARLYEETRQRLVERQHAEEARQASERRFRAIFEGAAIGVALVDMEGRLVEANPAVQAMLAPPGEDIRGRRFADLTYPDDVDPNLELFHELMDGRRDHYRMEKRYRGAAGNVVWANLTASLLRDASGAPEFVVGMVENITERKQAQEQIRRQLERLAALRSIDVAITSSLDMNFTLDVFLDKVISQLGVDAAHVVLLNPHTQMLEAGVGRGFRTPPLARYRQRLGEGYSGRVALERRMCSIASLAAVADFEHTELLTGEDFMAYCAIPLISKAQVKGVLEIFHRAPLVMDADWLGFLEALAGQAAIAIDNATMFDDLQRSNAELALAYDTTLEGWSRALELRDKETEGHTQRVTERTLALACAAGMSDAALVQVRRGALLHDIGKMGIPDAILLKPGPLTDEEWVIMRRHPVYAYHLLYPIAFLRPALDIPYCHHEKWDGSGYPRGLRGEEIPLAARVFAVVDVWDALRSDRPYRAGWPPARVRAHIAALAGTHFDPHIVDVFLQMEE